ncbi:hypothetical protein [Burkholderia cenocepacia]|uniref:hypothetical protein n=1 Tax=Burkholderia cenocepacia TaxID=95486 RepID=UPI0028B64391|nr:hypothetical protein [Burkholderia cenocepacia]MDT6995095.1 hypothetical protein [Burkholderia cenocepacia]
MKKRKEQSIAILKFRIAIEAEIRLFWHVLASLEYGNRYLGSVSPQPSVLAENPGDKKNPFKSINITPIEFISNAKFVAERMRENSVVSIVTTFERFLFDQLERIIYIAPEKLDKSEMEFQACELVLRPRDMTFNRWLAARVSDRILRNFTHREMIARIGGYAKFSLGQKKSKQAAATLTPEEAVLDEWHRWTLVRNSIVHTARSVTTDLALGWPQRFPKAGAELLLKDEDVVSVHKCAIFLAEYINEFSLKNVLGKHDATLLAREVFIQYGISDPKKIRELISETVRTVPTFQETERLIAEQKKGRGDDGWSLTRTELLELIRYSGVQGIV